MAEKDLLPGRGLVRADPSSYAEPAGDPGWFGPRSVAWQVHADLGPMLVGGLAALFLQSLHPLVMQGVADHSDYRKDPFGRLGRTAEFIAATTYGGDQLAQQLVRRVRAIHRRVVGVTPEGVPYRADDPQLLAYVHVTEVWSFLRAHQRYSAHPLLLEEKNRYLTEMSVVARRLGAGPVPVRTSEVREYLRSVRPQLRATEASLATVSFLTATPPAAGPGLALSYKTLTEAAVDLLPDWAREQLGLRRLFAYRAGVIRPAAGLLTGGLRFVIGLSPVLETARKRTVA
jgi:uncharacterized protein (DUF2236 family)